MAQPSEPLPAGFKPGQSPWRNRIVGSGEEKPDQLLANPKNWRIHPRQQQEALAGVLDEVGWVQQVLVNKRTGCVVDGHLRVSLALRREEPTVPVLYVDLDEAEEALVLATLDPISAMAGTDSANLNALLHEVDTGSAVLQEMLSALAEKSNLYTVDPSDAPELASGDRTPFQHMTFTLHDEQVEEVKAAMDKAKREGGAESAVNENSNGNALAFIAQRFNRG